MADGRRGASKLIKAKERQNQALELRRDGRSLRAIGEALGVSHEQARKYLSTAMADLANRTRATAESLVALELARLDKATAALAPQVEAGEVQAIHAWVRVSESRRRLLGLDPPATLLAAVEHHGNGRSAIMLPQSEIEDNRIIIEVVPARTIDD